MYNNYGSSGYVPKFNYATSPNGPWTDKSIFTATGYPRIGAVIDITFQDGKYIVLTYSTTKGAAIGYCDSLDGTWSTVSIGSLMDYPHVLRYVNSMWILLGYDDDNYTYFTKLAYASEITGDWTVVDIEGPNYYDETDTTEYETTPYAFDIIFYKGFYLALVQGTYKQSEQSGQQKPIYLMYSNTLNGPWMFRYLESLGTTVAVRNGGGYGIEGSLYWDGGFNSGHYNPYTPRLVLLENGEIAVLTHKLRYIDTSKITLPNISLDSAYSYIKVEE